MPPVNQKKKNFDKKGAVKWKKKRLKWIPNPDPPHLSHGAYHCQLLASIVFYIINATIVANHKGVLY